MKSCAFFLLTALAPFVTLGQALPITDGLKVWLKADAIQGLKQGDVVTAWPDSATGFIPGDGAQTPTLSGGGAGTPRYTVNPENQMPAVLLNNSALAYVGSLGLNSAEGAQGFTVFVVGSNNKTPISPAFSFGDAVNGVGDGSGGTSVKCDISTGTGGNNTGSGLRFNDGRRLFNTANFLPDQWRIGFWRMDIGDTYSRAVYRVDDLGLPQTGVSGDANPLNLLDEGFHVGAAINSGTQALDERMNGSVAEILFYTRALTEAEANQVGYYLEQKYALDTAYQPQTVSHQGPNVLLMLVDDLGFSDFGSYGGEARTPNIDRLAAGGLSFRNFHNTSRCSPTRMALLTGLYTHQAATDPGASLPPMRMDNNITIPEVLRHAGYRTYMAGKWHLGSASGQIPRSRGFQHVFGMGPSQSGNGADYWTSSAYSFDSQESAIPPRAYGSGPYQFYQTDAITDYAIDFLDHHLNKADNGRFFIYLPFNAPHFDIQVDKALAETAPPGARSYLDIYSEGWDVVRSNRYERMLSLGVIDSRYRLAPFSDTPYNGTPAYQPVPLWNTIGANRQADAARRMALYTAMIDRIDQNLGRIMDRLRASGQLDNTLIFLLSDNGSNAEGGMFGWARTGSENGRSNNHPPLTGTDLAEMGQPFRNDQLSIGGNWANVGNTPFRMFKRYSHEGGTQTPLIVHWPAGIIDPGRWTDQRGHLVDIMRTIVDVTGVAYPTQFNGHAVLPMEGESLAPIFRDAPAFSRTIGFEHESTRAWIDGDWKLVTKTGFSDGSVADALELYNLATDPTELTNVAFVYPERLLAMVRKWNDWAGRVGVPADRQLVVPSNATPAEGGADLFLDTFSRPDSWDADASAAGMSGSRLASMGANAAYYEGYEGSGQTDSIYLLGGRMRIAYGNGMSENGIMHNFIGQDIIDAGGFSVSMRVTAILGTATDTANRYVGFGVGLTEAEASKGGEISGSMSFRGGTANPVAKADFFVELDIDGNVKAWSKGQLRSTVPVGRTEGTLTASFELDGFSTSSPVTVNVFFDGQQLDLNAADLNSKSQTFKWDNANMNYVGLSARSTTVTEIDNLAIRKLPLAPTLASEYAMDAGLTGPDSAPDADPDGDRHDNLAEWLMGANPAVSDAHRQLLMVRPSPEGEFRFSHYRLKAAAAAGINYSFACATNLVDWTSFTPEQLSSEPDGSGRDLVLSRIPPAFTTGHPILFVQMRTHGPQP